MDFLQLYTCKNIELIYFFYGLSFFTMGIVIAVQPLKDSRLELANIIWLIAIFGITHGLKEWLDLWEIIKGKSDILNILQLSSLLISFMYLFEFGRKLVLISQPKMFSKQFTAYINKGKFLMPLITALIILISEIYGSFLEHGSILIRYMLCFPSCLLISIGTCAYYRRNKSVLDTISIKPYFQLFGISFVLYGIVAGFITSPGNIMLSKQINTTIFFEFFYIPVELVRALVAILISLSMVKILSIFRHETSQQIQSNVSKLKSVNEQLSKEINAHVKTEQQLLESKNELQGIYDSMVDGMLVADCQTRKILRVNKTMCIMTQYAEEELVGLAINNMHPEKDTNNAMNTWCTLSNGEMNYAQNVPCKRKDNSVFYTDIGAARLYYSNRQHLIASFRDVTERIKTEEKIRVLAKFPDENPNPVMRIGSNLSILYANKSSLHLLKSIFVRDPLNKLSLSLSEDWQPVISKVLEENNSRNIEKKINSKIYSFSIAPVSDDSCVYIYGINVTERKKYEEELRLNTAVFENTGEGILITDAKGIIHTVNPAFEKITGFRANDAIGKSPNIMQSGKHNREFYNELWKTLSEKGQWNGEIWNKKKNGEIYPQETSINVIKDEYGNVSHYASIFNDITERKNAEEILRTLSTTDALTGLANRRTFDVTLIEQWQRVIRIEGFISLILFDIDHFKTYNDNYGHIEGDQCLRKVAGSLSIGFANRSGDLVARYGGEEFAIILPLADETSSSLVAERVRKTVEDLKISHEYSKTSKYVTISVGVVAMVPKKEDSPTTLIKMADNALYNAKNSGRNCVRTITVNNHQIN